MEFSRGSALLPWFCFHQPVSVRNVVLHDLDKMALNITTKNERTAISLLHTICHYSQTTTKPLFRKKIWILQNTAKMHLQTIRHRQQFSRATCKFVQCNEKCLCVSSKEHSVERRQRRTKDLFVKHQRKCSAHYSCFVAFLSVHPFFVGCLRIGCSGLLSILALYVLHSAVLMLLGTELAFNIAVRLFP